MVDEVAAALKARRATVSGWESGKEERLAGLMLAGDLIEIGDTLEALDIEDPEGAQGLPS
ncbi:hypothetical protein [Streptomyces sp. NPDC020996]|uniref:hypothetical protein n=1 Tax=Streptomyces sp. NPDC020996 TaxID=3154791 RepID=UPI0033EF2190